MKLNTLKILGLSALLSLTGCAHMNHRYDYVGQAATIPPLVSPPGVAPIIKDTYYPLPDAAVSSNGPPSLIPPGSNIVSDQAIVKSQHHIL